MRHLVTATTIVLLQVSSFPVFGQKTSSQKAPGIVAQLSPVPPFPSSGIITPTMEAQYVYFDPKTKDLVLSYPVSLLPAGISPQSPVQAGRVREVIKLNNKVDPFFSVRIDQNTSNDTLVYSYVVRNGPKALQPIAHWFINTPHSDALSAFRSQIPDPMSSINESMSAEWSARSNENGILPGVSGSSYTVRSSLRPGFVRAFVSGSISDTELYAPDLPKPVQAQLDALRPYHLNQQQALAIGPKFSSSTPDSAIVSDFLSGIQILTKHQYLSESSPMLKELCNEMQSYLEALRITPEAAATELPRFVLHLTSLPANPFEEQILSALRISLSTN